MKEEKEEREKIVRKREEEEQQEIAQTGDIGEMMRQLRETKSNVNHADDYTNLSLEELERDKMAEEIIITYQSGTQ